MNYLMNFGYITYKKLGLCCYATYVVRKVCVHQDNEVSSAMSQSVDVGTSEAHFSRSSVQFEFVAVDFL